MIYDGRWTVRQGLEKYFVVNGFGGPNYDDKWVKVKLGPIPIFFLNSNARRRAVKLHDIHHVLTEYPTSLKGEALIGAWELASGCASHIPAWILNFSACLMGLFICPRELFQAFKKGRSSKNLYRSRYDDSLLGKNIGELRDQLLLDSPHQ